MNKTGLYVHVPFCLRKCLYCDFNSYALQGPAIDAYLQAVGSEIALYSAQPKFAAASFATIFIGGGTPTVLQAGDLSCLIRQCRDFARLDNGEITVEANPGTINPEKLVAMRCAGVNRLSLGVQSLDEGLLKVLGRAHSALDALQAYDMARTHGFTNISVDLMFALPGQTMEQWQDTVDRIVSLRPEHISCYSLIVEEGTPFGDRHAVGLLALPGEDLEASMYEWVIERLRAAGYEQYEISNFALPGFRCEHNQIYWRNRWYLGLGPGAHSHWAGERFANERSPAKYRDALAAGRLPISEREQLSRDEQMDETLLMGLRLLDGVRENEFTLRFGQRMTDVYGQQIARLVAQGLLTYDNSGARLTPGGLLLGNQVFAEFLR